MINATVCFFALLNRKMRFVLIDESIVSHGYWVRVSGAQLEQFRKNPMMYWMHQRWDKYGDKNQILPIGRWKDIRVENINGIASITAEAVFDDNDEFAMKIKSKVDGDFIKMASAGLIPLSWSDLPEDSKPGQTRSTITEWEMLEASIVDIGANKNAFRLMNADGTVNLSFGQNHFDTKHEKTQKMKVIALKLGLIESATESEVIASIESLQQKASNADKLQSERIEKLMKHPKINDDNKAHFEKLAQSDFDLAEKTLNILSQDKPESSQDKTERISDYIKQGKHVEIKSKKWEELSEDQLVELRESKPAEYEILYEKHFGKKPVIN